ncbi:hypothetical protein RI129_007896 [Pyrocoelia pectoralis]|uniref:Glucose-methanol-choline oxidoreductase N-terminal domain-containing protein n=1 Tax=Pyrocoelia pectoralis TaxID=417401 RepID=A0AAN7VEF4_9COLE
MLIKLVTQFLLLTSVVFCSNDEVDFYVKLIEEETGRAYTALPTDSSGYQPKYESMSYFGNFDYIIVGAGSAGAVVANRLSEDLDRSVLLIEAGGYETDFTDIPLMNEYTKGLEFNWNYNTTPQTTACLGMLDKECPYPVGKGLGGTSIINALMYVRGNQKDFNNWYQQGNPGWAYDDVLPYFIKSESSHVNGDRGYHGYDGYLNVEYHKPSSPELAAFLQANIDLGRKIIDYNGKEQLGVAQTQHNTKNGKRHSTGRAFIDPVKHRPNLKILTHRLVTKILIDKNRKAYGVLFSGNGKLYSATVTREIIVSAGSIASPQLLMLSGIGPRAHLVSKSIPVIQSLSVGENFQDHATYFALNFITNYTEPHKSLEQNVVDYLNSSGPFTIPGNSQGLGFFRTKLSKTPNYPDIELIMNPSNSTGNSVQRVYHYNDEVINTIYKDINPSQTFSLIVILLHPKSRGTIKLKSNSPYEYPLIDPKFFSDPGNEDLETMYQGIKLALEIVDTEPFKKLGAKLMYAPLPACKRHWYLSRKFWYCQIRQLTSHIYHPIGTCKMGPNPFSGAVVDHELKVHGVDNLRVADASIIPEATSGHTNAVAIMIGEKVSDLIKGSYS